MRLFKTLLAATALMALTAGVAYADVAPADDDDDEGGCAVGDPSGGVLTALGIGVLVIRRREQD